MARNEPGFRIRIAAPHETVVLHDMLLAAPDRADWTPDGRAPSAPLLLAELDLLAAEGRVWTAEDRESGAPVGMAALGEIDSALFLTALGVAATMRHRGIGAALVRTMVLFGRAAYFPAVYAVARRHGAPTAWLEKNGFTELGGDRLSPGIKAILAEPWRRPGAGQWVALARPL